MQSDNYQVLINKLDEFIRKFYVNKLIRGLLYAFGAVLLLFVLVNVVEYFLYLSSSIRKLMFYGFIGTSVAAFAFWVFIPLLNYFRLGKVISHEKAASIIGQHFDDVKDKLLNVLQLKELSKGSDDVSLITASIDQKIVDIKPIPFTSAINLGENKKYAKYMLVPLLIFLAIFLGSPNIIKDGTKRLLYNNTEFEREAPFTFKIDNDKLECIQFGDIDLDVSVDGDVLPESAYIKYNNTSFKLEKTSKGNFKHRISNIQKDLELQFHASGYYSKKYKLKMIPKPMLLSFDVSLDYPAYIQKKDETIENIGDLVLPEGTKVNWSFKTKNTESVSMVLMDSLLSIPRLTENEFSFSKTIVESGDYVLKVSNQKLKDADSVMYTISVIHDYHPEITVEKHQDSTDLNVLFFLGEASDDYGLSTLYFKYKNVSDERKNTYEAIPVTLRGSKQYGQFSHYWNLKELGLLPGDEVNYFFEVWDNDRVNGSKFTRSGMMSYKLPSIKELEENTDKNNEEIEKELLAIIDEAKEIKEDLNKVKEDLLQKKNLDWQDKKALQDINSKQQDMNERVEELQKKFGENIDQQSEYKEQNEKIAEKQKMLEELFEKIMDDEMKELFEKLESMLDDMKKEDLLEQMEDMEMSDEQLEKELDRMLELFKHLEFEQKMTETIDKLEELAKEQDELQEETESKSKENEELAKEQEEINEKFEDIKEDLADLDEMQEDLKKDTEEEIGGDMEEEISEKLSDSKQSLDDNKSKKASESQKKASDKMKEMSEQMAGMMNKMQMDQLQLDMRAIRQLLENLVDLSEDQEELFTKFAETNINNPAYVSLIQEQFRIKDDSKQVEDSLYALSKRVFQIQSYVTEKITDINRNLKTSIKHLADRKVNKAIVDEQLVMTGFNDLALMLSEVMEQMQEQMANEMQGMQMCQKPGQGKGNKPKLSDLQKQLNDQIKEMSGQKKPGAKKGKMSKEFAEMAKKQAAVRDALRKLNESENSDGEGSMGDLEKLMEEMNKTETDLVNKQLTEEMLNRQQEITTRLLEAEEAMRTREEEKKREAITAKEIQKKVPPSLDEYLKKRQAEVELYKTLPPKLVPYYKVLVEKYFKTLSF